MPSPSDVPSITCSSPLANEAEPKPPTQLASSEEATGVDEVQGTKAADADEYHVPGPFEPPLIHTIIEHYEGDIVKNVYQGRGLAKFRGGSVYNGEFKEGKMHGKGCYTWPDGTCYDGSFVDNKIQGEGKYAWPDGSTFVGTVSNGLRDGYGVFQTGLDSPFRKYEGEWSQGKRQGKGKMMYNKEGTCFYNGEWVDNFRSGQGEFRYPSGSLYIGDWLQGLKNGFGSMVWEPSKDRYVGYWQNGLQHGHGEYTWVSDTKFFTMCNRYKGEWKEGRRHGKGSYFYASGAYYEGEWEENTKHGIGTLVFENGSVFNGEFSQNRMVNFDKQPTTNEFGMPKELEEMITSTAIFAGVKNVFLRHISDLRKMYTYYSQQNLSSNELVFTMTRMDFWKFIKDCHITNSDFTLVDIDRIIAKHYERNASVPIFQAPHEPTYSILQRDFYTWLVMIAEVRFPNISSLVDKVSHLFVAYVQVRCRTIFPHSAPPKSESGSRSSTPGMHATSSTDTQILLPVSVVDIYHSEVKESVKSYMQTLWGVYKRNSTKKEKALENSENDTSMSQRDSLMMFKRLDIIPARVSARQILEALNPRTEITATMTNQEVSFLEFVEAILHASNSSEPEQPITEKFKSLVQILAQS